MRTIDRNEILTVLRQMNRQFAPSGFHLVGLFGSYARGEAGNFSDIDIAYRIDHAKFHPDNAFKKTRSDSRDQNGTGEAFQTQSRSRPLPQRGFALKKETQKGAP